MLMQVWQTYSSLPPENENRHTVPPQQSDKRNPQGQWAISAMIAAL